MKSRDSKKNSTRYLDILIFSMIRDEIISIITEFIQISNIISYERKIFSRIISHQSKISFIFNTVSTSKKCSVENNFRKFHSQISPSTILIRILKKLSRKKFPKRKCYDLARLCPISPESFKLDPNTRYWDYFKMIFKIFMLVDIGSFFDKFLRYRQNIRFHVKNGLINIYRAPIFFSFVVGLSTPIHHYFYTKPQEIICLFIVGN